MTAQRWSEDLGSVAEEAGRLLESLRRAGGEPEASARDGDPTPGDGDGTATPEGSARAWSDAADDASPRAGAGFTCEDPVCQWCPVCRASAFVRQLSPETLTGLAEFAGFAATVLTDLASARARAERPENDRDD